MDMSLLQPLSQILKVSVNDILSGEIIEETKIREKAEENLVNLSKYAHYESITKGTMFLLAITTIIIIYSWIKNLNCLGYSTLLFGFSTVVYYVKYKQTHDRKMLIYCSCMIVAFIFNFISFFLSTL